MSVYKFSILFILSLFLISCKFNETPEFIKVSNVTVLDYSPEKITVASDLVFRNPNHLGGILKMYDVKVFVNDIDMGNIKTADFKVPTQEEFIVPIKFEFPYNKIFQEKENLLLNVLNTLTDKKIHVKYEGVITYKLNVFSYDYPLNYSQEINLKKS